MSHEILRAAATKLREAAASIRREIKTTTYWHGVPVEDAWARGSANALGGPAGEYAALFGPDVAEALAGWLTVEAASAAGDEDHTGCTPETCTTVAALATARALLGEVAL